jgi:hypothetical protein
MARELHRSVVRRLIICVACSAAPAIFGQTASPPAQNPPSSGQANRSIPVQATNPDEELPRRLFWLIPNYRSHPNLSQSKPLSSGEKFRLAARDSFDRGTFLLAGFFAGIGQATNSTPSYGQGMAGFGRYYGSTYGDLMIGNFMTEAIFPSLLKQDPRYFRRGKGSSWSRLRYAVGQIFITHGDDRRTEFNYSEIFGNATAVAISNAYNPDNRTASDNARKLAFQLGIDAAGNLVKEFAPDLYRKVAKKHPQPYTGNSPTGTSPSK